MADEECAILRGQWTGSVYAGGGEGGSDGGRHVRVQHAERQGQSDLRCTGSECRQCTWKNTGMNEHWDMSYFSKSYKNHYQLFTFISRDYGHLHVIVCHLR